MTPFSAQMRQVRARNRNLGEPSTASREQERKARLFRRAALLAVAALALLVALVAAPGSASAATLGTSGSEMEYRGTPGASDSVFLRYRRNRDFYTVASFSIGHIARRAPCFGGPDPDKGEFASQSPIAGCPASGLQIADIELGDRNDELNIGLDEDFGSDEGSFEPRRPLKINADGGSGRDQIEGGPLADRLFGGSGNDNLFGGGSGNDLIRGGSGNDFISGGGRDKISGDSGRDQIVGIAGSDRISGGSGNDFINGGGRFSRGDRADRISGGAGNDKLVDYQSGKETTGDRFSGGPGNDKINDRDGNRDYIDCGRGRDDAYVDRKDKVARNCESVRRPGK